MNRDYGLNPLVRRDSCPVRFSSLHRRLAFFISALALGMISLSIPGCSQAEPVAVAAENDSPATAAESFADAESPPERDELAIRDDAASETAAAEASDFDLKPAETQEQRGLIGGLIGGLRSIIERSDVLQEGEAGESMLQQLDIAAGQLGAIRDQNRRAIHEVNRQVRPRRGGASPNIVLIHFERLTPSDLFDVSEVQAPTFATLCMNGTRFSRFYTAGSDLKTARWSLMRGLSPGSQLTSGKAPSLSSLLWDGGYSTAFIGQWDDAQFPLDSGFEEWVGFRDRAAAASYPRVISLDRTEMKLVANQNEGETRIHAVDLFFSEAMHYLKRQQGSRRPFFLQIALPEFTAEVQNGAAPVVLAEPGMSRLIKGLIEFRLASNTCLIVTAESGPVLPTGELASQTLADGSRIFPHGLGEGNLHIPLLIYWPQRVSSGTVDHLSCSWDLLPTLLDITSTTRRSAVANGISFAPLLNLPLRRSQPQKEHKLLYWVSPDQTIQAVRKGEWKGMLMRGETAVRLYDLQADPGESRDVAASAPEIVEQMLAR